MDRTMTEVAARSGLRDDVRDVARAVAGDQEALRRLAASGEGAQASVTANRLAAALASRAVVAGMDGPCVEEWRKHLRATAASRLILETGLAQVGEVLDAAGIDWLPLKGMGLPAGTYERLEERPTTDLDVLVRREDLERAVGCLREAGWRDVHPHPLCWRFLVEEGYNWQAVGPLPVLLELHFRLWGSVPERFVAELMDRARPAPERGQCALAIDPVDAAIVAAVHFWQTPVPRPMLFLWDLERLTAAVLGEAQREELVRRTVGAGLQLYLALSMGFVQSLWPSAAGARVLFEAQASCGRFERWVLRHGLRSDWDRITLGSVVLARLFDRRPSRTGWMAPVRSVWPHPGTLASQFPGIPGRAGRRARSLLGLLRDPSRLNRRGAARSARDGDRG